MVRGQGTHRPRVEGMMSPRTGLESKNREGEGYRDVAPTALFLTQSKVGKG